MWQSYRFFWARYTVALWLPGTRCWDALPSYSLGTENNGICHSLLFLSLMRYGVAQRVENHKKRKTGSKVLLSACSIGLPLLASAILVLALQLASHSSLPCSKDMQLKPANLLGSRIPFANSQHILKRPDCTCAFIHQYFKGLLHKSSMFCHIHWSNHQYLCPQIFFSGVSAAMRCSQYAVSLPSVF